jgi:hypothetical protein
MLRFLELDNTDFGELGRSTGDGEEVKTR